MDKYIGNFYWAKIPLSYNNKIIGGYKYRPVLIIDKVGKYYKCLTITSQRKDMSINRIDVGPQYNLRHSQIICNNSSLILPPDKENFIATCSNDDFEYIMDRYKTIGENK